MAYNIYLNIKMCIATLQNILPWIVVVVLISLYCYMWIHGVLSVMIIEPISRYVRTDVITVNPGDTIQMLIETMAKRRVRHILLRGTREFLTVDSVFNLIYRMSGVVRDPRHLESMKAGSLKTVKPPVVSGFISIAEAARVMVSSNLDFILVDHESGLGLLTVRDMIRAIEPGEAREPAIRYSTPRYPSVRSDSKVLDVVKAMGLHGVRSVLVLEDRRVVGVIPSLSVIDSLARFGFHTLWDEVMSVTMPVEAVAPSNATIEEVVATMRKYGSEAVILTVKDDVVGIVDEWGVIKALAGLGERLTLGSGF